MLAVLGGRGLRSSRRPAQQAHAAKQNVAKQVSPDKAAPLLLQADDLVYDNRNNRVIARGNVEIYYRTITFCSPTRSSTTSPRTP